jgi:hypothetical protein
MAFVMDVGCVFWEVRSNESDMTKFKYLGKTAANQNYLHEEIKEQIKFRKYLLPSSSECFDFPFRKSLKIKIYKTIILPFILYVCETWSFTQRE